MGPMAAFIRSYKTPDDWSIANINITDKDRRGGMLNKQPSFGPF